jgi:uncharacterized membrane protein YraQ (UPF0718 family)
MMKTLKRYRFFIIVVVAVAVMMVINRSIAFEAMSISWEAFLEMAFIVPPIFILLGLLDIWVPRQTMVKYMGEDAGFKGIVLAFVIGSAAAGPLYGAFPVAAIFMKKGVKFSNVLIFIGAWSTTKIPMFLFELSSLGARFAVTRLLVDIPGIIIMSYVLTRMISKEEVAILYRKAEEL